MTPRTQHDGHRRRPHVALIAAVCGLLLATPASAETFPTGPVRLVVPFAAGGGAGALARSVAHKLSELWGQQVYVENKGGANTQIGAALVAKSPADGYTLMLTSESTFVMNALLVSKLQYDPVNDFAPIAGLVDLKQALVVNKTVKAKNLREFVDLAKSKPGALTYGTIGFGSSSHLNMEMLQVAADIKLTAAHYKGAGPIVADLLGGHIGATFVNPFDVLEHHKNGNVTILAMSSSKRTAILPDIPTVAESGFPGLDGTSWFGLFAPAGTPTTIIKKVAADVKTIFYDPAFREKLLAVTTLEANIRDPQELATHIEEGRKKWGAVIQKANLKAN